MKTKVCAFVWNHFTNDARVMRECTALSEDGYDVDLVCIQDPSDNSLMNFEEINPHFRVHRVRRYPMLFSFLQSVYHLSKEHKLFGVAILLFLLAAVWSAPLVTIPILVLSFLLLKTKLKVVWIRGSIILRMIMKGRGKDYSIYHSNDLNTLPQGYIASKLRFKKRKLVYDSHEVQTSRTGYNSKWYGRMESFLIKKIDYMIVENHTRAAYNEELYGFYPGVVYNYPFKKVQSVSRQKKNLHSILGLPSNEKILLYQGGIQTGRGLENIVKAMPLIQEGTLVFIGDGRIKDTLMKMVSDMKLEHRVKFLPKVPLQELPSYTENAFLGFQVLNNVCFNHYSASSNKLFEYLMSGVPVVACDFPEIKKVVEGNLVGICVDSHDYKDIARAVNHMIEHPSETIQFGLNAAKASDQYNWEKEKLNFMRIYESLGGESA